MSQTYPSLVSQVLVQTGSSGQLLFYCKDFVVYNLIGFKDGNTVSGRGCGTVGLLTSFVGRCIVPEDTAMHIFAVKVVMRGTKAAAVAKMLYINKHNCRTMVYGTISQYRDVLTALISSPFYLYYFLV